jgi:hypothetical protein
VPFDSEDHDRVLQSVLTMRQQLSDTQRALPLGSPAEKAIRAMRLTCERFLTDTPSSEVLFYSNLGELRGVFGAELSSLCDQFGVQVAAPLTWIIPPKNDEDVVAFVPEGEVVRTLYFEPPPGIESEPRE